MLNFSKILKKITRESKDTVNLKEALRIKYLTFQGLLAENNHVLTLMADMEEKLSGEYLFDRQYINSHIEAIAEGVLKIIKYLNAISENRYGQLFKAYENINGELKNKLSGRLEIPVSDLVIPLERLDKDMSGIAGGKIAHLGEIKNKLHLFTPEGFSISSYAFKKFMEHNRLAEKINTSLESMRIDDLRELEATSRRIQSMVAGAEAPPELEHAVREEVESLKVKVESSSSETRPLSPSTVKKFYFSVRSSAVREDGEFSFAGQYATFLNVREGLIIQKYKEVVASLFTPRAIFYYKTKGFSEDEIVMAVGVLTMVDADAAGVIYSRDPNGPEKETAIINAARGLGKAVVDGTVNPDSYIVSRETRAVMEKAVPEQKTMFICGRDGEVKEVEVPEELRRRPCLSDEQAKELTNCALLLEKHYGSPQDIEWAIDRENRINILQSRPLKISDINNSASAFPRKVDGYNILIDRGVIACKGIGYGRAFVLGDEERLADFPEGGVLVAKHTSTKFVTVMNRATAIITDVGGATGHMASLSREYGIPTIVDAGNATSLIKDGQEITVDAFNCNIYEGRVAELIGPVLKSQRSTFKDTHLFKTLETALKLIVPLRLVDPDNENFKPELCGTFHDITRFAHEMAMAEIFKTRKGADIDSFEDIMSAIAYAESGEAKRLGEHTSALRAGIPIDAHLLDIGGGVRTYSKKVAAEEVVSIPFSSFLKGLTNMKWPEPRAVDAKGFLGMMANTASMREEELYKMGGKSYAIVSRNYMNFSIRLGYHFSMVEAYADENMNDNYIKFFFKGGGAATDRRLRRVRLITEILKKMDFKVNVIEDVIDAMLTKYKQATIEEKLEIMGKLTVYTKQLDMAMFNDAVTDMFIEDFIRDHMKTRG